MKKRLSFVIVMLLIVAAGLCVVSQYRLPPDEPAPPDTVLSVLFLDVGQADAALAQCGGHWMLIDGGGRDSSQKIYSVLEQKGITQLDLVIASHPHEDHIGGLSAAFQNTQVGRVLCPTDSYSSKSFQNLQRFATEKSGGITVPQVGDAFSLGPARVEILAVNTGPEENDSSIVAKLSYGEVSFLFTGDIDGEQMTPQWAAPATVLKVSHHGSSTGTNRSLMDAVAPEYAVLSLGADNPYGFPHGSVLELLEESCKAVYRTDLQGDITFTSDGKTGSVTTRKQATSREIFTPGDREPAANRLTVNTLPYSYIVNTSSKIFHLPSCPSTEKMKESNKQYSTQTRDELIAQGLKPCGSCKP